MNTDPSENPNSSDSPPEPQIACPNCGGALTPDFIRAEAAKLSESEPPKESLLVHWSFFETIDADLHEYSRYLEFDPRNFGAYSVNFTRLYLSICSEIDVVLKMLCKHLSQPTPRGFDIDHYRKVLTQRYPNFTNVRVLVRPMNWLFVPWIEWKTTERDNPAWWRSDYDVKHERNVYFAQANLKNVLASATGLLVALVFWSACEPGTYKWQLIDLKVFDFNPAQRNILQMGLHLLPSDFTMAPAPFPQPPAQ